MPDLTSPPDAGTATTTAPLSTPPVIIAASSASDALVDAWFLEHVHNIPELGTELFNRLNAARDVLKARLNTR